MYLILGNSIYVCDKMEESKNFLLNKHKDIKMSDKEKAEKPFHQRK